MVEAMTRATDQHPDAVIASAAAGDEIAFGRIVAANHEDMRRVCAFITRDDAIADDAVQAAWSTAWRKIGTVRDPKGLRPWLMRVAINEAKQVLRKRRRRASSCVGSTSPAASGLAMMASASSSWSVMA